MIILTLRTDKPEAELGLYDDDRQIAYVTWQAHRQLAETIHVKMEALLHDQQKDLHDIQGIVSFQGPGSFTGLRIGLTVANALSYALQVPHAGAEGDNWIEQGITKIAALDGPAIVVPEYGAPVHITAPKK